MSKISVAALGRATRDFVVEAEREAIVRILARYNLAAQGVQFFSDLQLIESITGVAQTIGRAQWFPGGSISNTLLSLALCCNNATADPDLSFFWLGPTEYSDFAGAVSPLDFLRQARIKPYCFHEPDYKRLTLCFIDKETQDVVCILIYSTDKPITPDPDWPHADLLLTSINEVAIAQANLFSHIAGTESIALLIGDHPQIDVSTWSRLRTLAANASLKWLFGRYEDYLRLGLVVDGSVLPEFQDLELVGTQGGDTVRVWNTACKAFEDFATPQISHGITNTLGAGDAYAGGFLYARLSGQSLEQAHQQGIACAVTALQSQNAHIPVDKDLNVVFGPRIDRSSTSSSEGELFDKIRRSPGLIVISCGQTGVDQIGLQAASDLGLPAFAVMPRGRRTENTEGVTYERDDFRDAFVLELASESYRYCTWANVYLADATLLWDFTESEGSRETRRACTALNRPFLDVTRISPSDLIAQVTQWCVLHNIRVLNIAGNRKRFLGSDRVEAVYAQIHLVLRRLASYRAKLARPDWQTPRSITPTYTPNSERNLRIGLPNSRDSRLLLQGYLQDRFQLPSVPARKLSGVYDSLQLEFYFFRPRDLPRMLDKGYLDLIFCGSDLLDEDSISATIIADTGLQPCSIVMVGIDDAMASGLRIATQYPQLAARLLANHDEGKIIIRSINGTAEAWIRVGAANASIDTWRTGYICEANGLSLLHTFYSTSLVLACKSININPSYGQILHFADDFCAWLMMTT